MDEILRLVQENKISAKDVDRIEVGGNQSNLNTLFQHHPMTGLQAKFSMEFAVAILLVEGKAGLAQFTDTVVQRPDVQDMVQRVRFYVDPEFDKRGPDNADLQAVLIESSIIKVHTKDGKVISGRTKPAKGSPENPMSYDEIAEKFRGNAEFAKWPAKKAETVIAMVKSLENEPNMSRLTAALAN